MERIILVCNDIDWIQLDKKDSMVVVMNKPSKILDYDIMFTNDINNIKINKDKTYYTLGNFQEDKKETNVEETNVRIITCCTKLINSEHSSLLYIVFDWLKNAYPNIPIWLVGYQHKSGYEFDIENHYIMKYKYTRIISDI